MCVKDNRRGSRSGQENPSDCGAGLTPVKKGRTTRKEETQTVV